MKEKRERREGEIDEVTRLYRLVYWSFALSQGSEPLQRLILIYLRKTNPGLSFEVSDEQKNKIRIDLARALRLLQVKNKHVRTGANGAMKMIEDWVNNFSNEFISPVQASEKDQLYLQQLVSQIWSKIAQKDLINMTGESLRAGAVPWRVGVSKLLEYAKNSGTGMPEEYSRLILALNMHTQSLENSPVAQRYFEDIMTFLSDPLSRSMWNQDGSQGSGTQRIMFGRIVRGKGGRPPK